MAEWRIRLVTFSPLVIVIHETASGFQAFSFFYFKQKLMLAIKLFNFHSCWRLHSSNSPPILLFYISLHHWQAIFSYYGGNKALWPSKYSNKMESEAVEWSQKTWIPYLSLQQVSCRTWDFLFYLSFYPDMFPTVIPI